MRSSDLRLLRPAEAAEPRVAVMINANARKATPKVIRALSHVVSEEDLFVSRSQLEGRRIAQTLLDRRYHTVFAGGGDGTFMGLVNDMLALSERSGRPRRALPRFGVLRLGTGNGLAHLVNASPLRREGILDDVLRARANEVPNYKRLELLAVDGRRTPFAGVGVDGKLLNDYIWVKERLGRGLLRRVATGERGYFMSVAFKTLPHYLVNSSFVGCEVVNGKSSPAYRLGTEGQIEEEIPPGGLIYCGQTMMAAASTIPFYGFGLTMFPFAGKRRGMMHLRLGAVHAAQVVANLPKLWRGTWFPEGKILDFHATDVDIKFERPMPFQVGGDASGYRDRVRFGMATEQVELLDYTAAVH